MHKYGKQPVFEIRDMEGREFSASRKAIIIHCAFIISQKMTGNLVNQHHSIAPFFEVLLVKIFPFLL